MDQVIPAGQVNTARPIQTGQFGQANSALADPVAAARQQNNTGVASLPQRGEVTLSRGSICFKLCFALLNFALLCSTLLYFALLCFALLCFALLCFALLDFALLCFALPNVDLTSLP